MGSNCCSPTPRAGSPRCACRGPSGSGARRARRCGALPPTTTAAANLSAAPPPGWRPTRSSRPTAPSRRATPQRVVVRSISRCRPSPGPRPVLTYTVEDRGALTVEAAYHGVPGAPELPCFGVQVPDLCRPSRPVRWTGLSGETYPDRYKGGVFGCHEEAPHVEPHLVPQDCGLHVQTRQAVLQQRGPSAARRRRSRCKPAARRSRSARCPIPRRSSKPRSILPSCRPPAAPASRCWARRAASAASTSWGADVEDACRISGEADHTAAFCILLR